MRHRLHQSGNAAGKLISLVLVLGLLALGGWLVLQDMDKDSESPAADARSEAPARPVANTAEVDPIEPLTAPPVLDRAAPYVMRDNVLDVDLSEYAGYAGLIVANGGLEPNDDSFFAREYGFKLRIQLSEEESWSKLNNGAVGASVTTADVLAVLGRQFDIVVPAQMAFSRGADMIVADTGISGINGLRGKVLAGTQFNESEFFLRYLASEAGLAVNVLRDLDASPRADAVNLVFYEDATVGCEAYAEQLDAARPRLNGCVGWSPSTDETIAQSGGRAKMLVSNRNLLVIADLLLVNGEFARSNPDKVQALVHGLLEGNRQLRDAAESQLGVVGRAFGWSVEDTRAELGKVHFSNLPENLAFFQGTIDSAGSYQGIFQSSLLVYGDLIRNPADPARYVDLKALEALAAKPEFAAQKIAIAPIRSTGTVALEGDALLSRDIRFFYQPNSAELDAAKVENQEYLEVIRNFLQVSPGSVVVLRGHVDNARVGEFEQQGGQALVRSMALKAMELSRQRAESVRDALLAKYPKIDASRLELVGRGWEEPAGSDSELNRRVEVQWFTLE
jgi:NitT/TauT family transport system substrate-binding protein